MLDDIVLTKDFTEQERLLFQQETGARRKEPTTGVLLAVFLGDFGAHRFYMGQTGLGIVYLLFFWTFIPGLVGLVEAFLMPRRVREHNAAVGQEVSLKLRALRSGSEGSTAALLAAASKPPTGQTGRTLAAAAGGAVVGAAATRAAGTLASGDAAPVTDAVEGGGEEGGLADTLGALLGDE